MSQQNYSRTGEKRPLSAFKIAVGVFCLMIVVAALASLLWMFAFAGRTLTVEGIKSVRNPDGSDNPAYDSDGIFFSAGIGENTGFIFIDPRKAEARLTEALPYIESASVIKKYPSTVIIRPVYTRAAFAVNVSGGGTYALLSPSMKVLDTAAAVLPESVTVLKGIEFSDLKAGRPATVSGKEDKTGIVKELYAKLTEKYAPDRISMIDISSTMSIRFVFSAEYSITVNLGDRNDMDKKLRLASDSIEYTLTHGFNQNATLDISSPDGAIYHPEPAVEEEPSSTSSDTEAPEDQYDDDGYDENDEDYNYDEDYDSGE